jgi:hypothetical protein
MRVTLRLFRATDHAEKPLAGGLVMGGNPTGYAA